MSPSPRIAWRWFKIIGAVIGPAAAVAKGAEYLYNRFPMTFDRALLLVIVVGSTAFGIVLLVLFLRRVYLVVEALQPTHPMFKTRVDELAQNVGVADEIALGRVVRLEERATTIEKTAVALDEALVRKLTALERRVGQLENPPPR